jgi:hypothetical protein
MGVLSIVKDATVVASGDEKATARSPRCDERFAEAVTFVDCAEPLHASTAMGKPNAHHSNGEVVILRVELKNDLVFRRIFTTHSTILRGFGELSFQARPRSLLDHRF